VALSADGKWTAGSRGGRVRLFDVRTNEEVRTLDGEVQGRAVSLLFSPDGKWLAASGGTPSHQVEAVGVNDVFQGWVKVWNLASGEGKTLTELPLKAIYPDTIFRWPETERSPHVDYPGLVGFVSGKNQLVSGVGNEMQLWDIPTGKQVRSFPGGFGSLSPDGKTFATWDLTTNATRLWDLSSEKVITLKFDELTDPLNHYRPAFTWGVPREFGSVGIPTFHPDSDTVATIACDRFVRLWDRKTGRRLATLDPFVAVNNGVYSITLWDQDFPYTGKYEGRYAKSILREFNHTPWRPDISTRSIASFSPDGKILASPFAGNTLLWRVRDRTFLFKLEGQPLSFSPDGKKLATAVRDSETREVTRLWDVASGKPVLDLGGGDSFFPDGRTMYSGPRYWDAETGREQGVFNGYGGGGLAFSLDGKTLVSVSGDKATLWDMATAVKTDVPGEATVAPDGKSVAFEKEAPIKLHSPPSLSLPLSRKEMEEAGVRHDPLFGKPGIFDDPQVPLPESYPRRTVVSPNGKLRVELVNVRAPRLDESRETPAGDCSTRVELVNFQDGGPPIPQGPLAIVERAEGEARREGGPEGKYRGVVAAAFSPDGKYLALGREDGTILLWDISPAR
jgi:WD40 repeat protein